MGIGKVLFLIWIQTEGHFQRANTFIGIAQGKLSTSLRDVGFRAIRFELQRFTIGFQRFFKLACLEKRLGKVHPGIFVTRRDLDHGAIGVDGFSQPAEIVGAIRFRMPEVRGLCIQHDGTVEKRQRIIKTLECIVAAT